MQARKIFCIYLLFRRFQRKLCMAPNKTLIYFVCRGTPLGPFYVHIVTVYMCIMSAANITRMLCSRSLTVQ